MKLFVVTLLLAATTVCNGSTSLRATAAHNDKRKLFGPCGAISSETLAKWGMTVSSCGAMVGDTNKGGESCEAIECPITCAPGVKCVLVPGHDFQCGDPDVLAGTFNVARVNLKVCCDNEIALGKP